ncbi:MAG: histidine--tRNA ligase [bacterium]|nr:histidine--tRNA ligase [bacterium]
MEKEEKKTIPIQSLAGMHDILPEDQFYYRRFEKIFEKLCNLYNFKRIDTPILESADLFIKGTGAATDIVQKEMYSFRTKGNDWVALRPEGTPPVVRAYLEHGMVSWPQPIKLFYYGPFFRHESPQAGRYREFRQFGAEVLGESCPSVDSEVIALLFNIINKYGIKNLIVEINSLGCKKCNSKFITALVKYLRKFSNNLCQNCKRRIISNPFRVLDCKETTCREIIENAPQIIDYLCLECKEHFKEVLEFLDILEIPYTLNPYLVRGLDYYSKTVFEIFSVDEKNKEENDENEQNKKISLAGGGRFDDLIRVYNKRNLPACGGGIGVERVIDKLKEMGIKPEEDESQVFLVQIGDSAKKISMKILQDVRAANIKIEASLNKDNLREQLGRADKLKIPIVLILGQKEAAEGKILIRDMASEQQDLVRINDLIQELKKIIKT